MQPLAPAATGDAALPAVEVPDAAETVESAASRTGPRLLVVAGVLAGIALRAWILRSDLGAPDYDEAIVGLMARHAQQGHLSMFFWGQPYGGAQEPFLVAVLFSIFGRHAVVMKLVPIALHAVACVLTWRIGIRLLGPSRARMAGLLLWVFPAAFVWWSTKERGFYGLAIVLGLGGILLCLRLAEEPRTRDLVLLGASGGLGLWVSPQTAYLALPAIGWLVCTRPAIVRRAGWAVLAGAVAAAPWVVWNLQHDWRSLTPPDPERHLSYLGRVGDFWGRLPVAFGLEEPFSGKTVLPGPWIVQWIAAAALLALGIWVARRRGVLLWIVACFPFLYAINSLVSTAGDHPRYLYLFMPIVALALAAPLRSLRIQAVALAVAVGLSVWGLGAMHAFAHQTDQPNDLTAGPLHALIADLDARHITHVTTDHVGPQLTFATDERIIGATYTNVRYPPYDRSVRRQPTIVYVLLTNGPQVNHVERALQAVKVGYRWHRVGWWTVIEPDAHVVIAPR